MQDYATKIIQLASLIPKVAPKGSKNGKIPEPVEHRFWRKINIKGVDDCWDWTGAVDRYGRFQRNGKCLNAHRFAYELTVGEIPNGLYICHTCDNPFCCNPNHLYAGTALENKEDCVVRGRHAKNNFPVRLGESVSGAKMTKESVKKARALREEGKTISSIASLFNMSISAMYSILTKKAWRHVN